LSIRTLEKSLLYVLTYSARCFESILRHKNMNEKTAAESYGKLELTLGSELPIMDIQFLLTKIPAN